MRQKRRIYLAGRHKIMFILSDQRDTDPREAFDKYREYLKINQARFPKSAYELATSDWYFNFHRHECPHDAWLESVKIDELSSGKQREIRTVAITARLMGAYHDGVIEIHYPQVFAYRFNSYSLDDGHRDWRYDEFRVDDSGRLVHEIEWCGCDDTGSWLIVASDIEFKWIPNG